MRRHYLLILCLAAPVAEAETPLLRNETPRYENYGKQGYRQYARYLMTRPTKPLFDQLGDELMQGMEVYSLREEHTESEFIPPGSALNKHQFYFSYLNGLAIANDSYKDWTTRLLIGDRIRTQFTPFTLDLSALNGIRWDIAGGSHRLSLVASRRDYPLWSLNDVNVNELQDDVTYLLGGRYERDWGPVQLGATFTNQMRVNSRLGSVKGGSIKGTTPSAMSRVQLLVVKVANAHKRLDMNARVYAIALTLNGESTDIEPVVTRHDAEFINQRFPNFDRFFPPGQTIPPFIEFINGAFAPEHVGPEGYLQADDSEFLLYWFEVPEDQDMLQASFDALVANNYAISVAEVFVDAPFAKKTDPATRNRATYFTQVAGTGESTKDGSNLRRLRIDYGRQTGNMVFGADAESSFKGFQFSAEFDVNLNHLQYPDLKGARHRREALAYFINLQREISDRMSIGGEYFNVDPDYSTRITVNNDDYGSYDDAFPIDLRNPFNVGFNNTMEMDTVDDNDDKDPDADFYFLPFDNNGVFPGRDVDQDGRPDINENDNELPDYIEPFLLYRVDPDEFEYGDDLNNNGVIDVREDDHKPDYLYDQNLQGWQLFAELRPTTSSEFTLGRYDTRQLWGGGENQVTYVKAEYQRDIPGLLRVRAVDYLKRVHDNIRNDVFRFSTSSTGFETVFSQDPLLFQNSMVNTAFAAIELYRFRPFHVRLQTLLERHRQWATPEYGVNWIRRSATVLRSDYTWNVGALSVMPQMKIMMQKVTDDIGQVHPLHEFSFYPIFKIYYQLTPDTTLRLGAQGFPFLKSRFRDLEREDTGYNARDYIISLSNLSTYNGYQFGLNVGYHLKLKRMLDRRRAFVDQDYTLFFIRLIAGLQPSQNL